MTTTQRPRTPRRTAQPPGPNPASRGLILVVIGVVLGLILLVKGGGVGFDSSGSDVKIGAGEASASSTTVAPATTVAAPTTDKAPQTVQVVAANGSKVSGLAGKTGQFLAQAGYSQVVSTDSLQAVPATAVYFGPGYEANAQAIAKLLNLQATQVQALPAGAKLAKNQPASAGVVVLLGPEVATVVGVTATGSSTTVAGAAGATTTVAGKTATTVAKTATTVAKTATTSAP